MGTCVNCGCEIEKVYYSGLLETCSIKCRNKQNNLKMKAKRQAKAQEAFKDADPYTYCECTICGYRAAEITRHLKEAHDLTTDEYKEKYNLPIKSQKLCDAVKGENNPGYQHGGKLSPFSKNFVNYQGDEKIQETIEKANITKRENANVPTTLEYFLKKANGDV